MSTATTERRPLDPYERLAEPIPKLGGKTNAVILLTRSVGRRGWRYSLRVWVEDKETGELRPTTRGVSFGEDKLTSVRDALIEACRKAGVDD